MRHCVHRRGTMCCRAGSIPLQRLPPPQRCRVCWRRRHPCLARTVVAGGAAWLTWPLCYLWGLDPTTKSWPSDTQSETVATCCAVLCCPSWRSLSSSSPEPSSPTCSRRGLLLCLDASLLLCLWLGRIHSDCAASWPVHTILTGRHHHGFPQSEPIPPKAPTSSSRTLHSSCSPRTTFCVGHSDTGHSDREPPAHTSPLGTPMAHGHCRGTPR